ncbi:unnamed protein product [Closterium sp. NIES-65]|nr:unnamed protein product [Closterium sp. NIES-65]
MGEVEEPILVLNGRELVSQKAVFSDHKEAMSHCAELMGISKGKQRRDGSGGTERCTAGMAVAQELLDLPAGGPHHHIPPTSSPHPPPPTSLPDWASQGHGGGAGAAGLSARWPPPHTQPTPSPSDCHGQGMAVAQELLDCPQVAVFDTAFHSTIPPQRLQRTTLPYRLYKELGVRRYTVFMAPATCTCSGRRRGSWGEGERDEHDHSCTWGPVRVWRASRSEWDSSAGNYGVSLWRLACGRL